jgi:hypothetical protein
MRFLNSTHDNNPTDVESDSTSSTQNTISSNRDASLVSWCRNVATKRKSLMYSENDTRHFAFISQSLQSSASRVTNIKTTNIFKPGHGYGSVFIDTTEKSESTSQLVGLIAEQYPSRTGVIIRSDATTKFVEINFNTDDPALDAILEKGLVFNDQSITIACKALHHDTDIVYVSLYHLPLIAENLLFNELKAALSRCGYVLDIGILVEPSTNTFMCDGYAIIDTRYKAMEPLKHIIQLDSYNNNPYAVWKGMPDYCACCHQQDHVVENCPSHKGGHIHTDIVPLENQEDDDDDDDFKKYTLFALKKTRECIDIAVKTFNGVNLWFRNRKRTSLLVELKKEFSEQQFLPLDQLLFGYNEHEILDDDTPEKLKMKDGATIVTTLVTL